jgi:hypothetical protein
MFVQLNFRKEFDDCTDIIAFFEVGQHCVTALQNIKLFFLLFFFSFFLLLAVYFFTFTLLIDSLVIVYQFSGMRGSILFVFA